jgi:regulator of cell morphogenesis and NO signaling
MTESFAERTVGEVVAQDWRTAAVFEQFGVDFCCGGRQTVAAACRVAGTNPATIEGAVSALPPQVDGEDASTWAVDRLVDHIVLTHHAYVRTALPRIAAYLTRLVQVHGARHPELSETAAHVEAVGRDLLQHMMKEERVLFPYIRELATPGRPQRPFGTVEAPIRMMEREHEEAGVVLQAIRALTNGYTPPADGCATYRTCLEELAHFERDLHRHVHLENNILFPKAVALESARR